MTKFLNCCTEMIVSAKFVMFLSIFVKSKIKIYDTIKLLNRI